MPYVPVPKDLTHVRQKVLFNLTRRQLVCFLGGALVGAPLFYLLKPYVASSAASLIMVLVMIPFILLGVYEKNGEPLEVVLKHFFTATFLRPKKRPYQSENLYDALERQSALQKDVAQIEKKKKRKKLSHEEKKLIRTKIKEADRRQETPHTAQKTIPYQRMYPDGICRVTDTRYTRTIQFQDINYQLSQNEDKQALFDGWCDFLNYFDPSIHFQFSFFDLAANPKVFEQRIDIPAQNDDFDSIRAEYANMLRSQLTRGNNGLQKQKYLTFGIEADSYKAAKTRLERIELDLLNNFRKLGVQAKALDGKARLELMHGICHMDTREPFRFDWSWLVPSGLTTQDFIAPSSFEFKDGRTFRIGKTYCAASYLQILAPELSDRALKNFLDMESSLLVSMHIHSLDQAEAVKTIKHKITELDRTKIEEQKKAVRAGYDMDIIPSDLATYGEEAKKLLQDLQSHNERMFLLTLVIINTADTKRQLENNVLQAQSIAQAMNCSLIRLDFQQENALVASLPLCQNPLNLCRGLTTSSVAIFVPFTTQELFQTGSEALYYGVNAMSSNLIMIDRKLLKNPNGLILGVPGSGKSFSAKREITNVFLVTNDDILICDPEAEYAPLVERLHGQVIHISPTSTDYINPLDLSMDYSDEENPLSLKSDFVLSLCELIVGGKDGLQPVERTVIDRCVRQMYREHLQDPETSKMPTLQTLYDLLCSQPEGEAVRLATALEIYVSGSLNVFNHETNVDLNRRLVCLDLKKLGAGLRTIAMLIMQDLVNSQVSMNFLRGIATWCYFDEFHVLLRDRLTASYCVAIWKMLRKKGCVPSALTQNVKDFLASPEIENIFENSDFLVLLSQAQGDRQILAKQLGISPHQLSYVTHTNSGEGLLFFGNTTIPFVDRFPQNTELYAIMTTRPEDKKQEMNRA